MTLSERLQHQLGVLLYENHSLAVRLEEAEAALRTFREKSAKADEPPGA